MTEKKYDIRIWDLILSLLGMAAASALIALASNGVLASHFLNLAFPVIIGIHLYKYFDFKKEFWQGVAGLAAYMVFRAFLIVVALRGNIGSLPEVVWAWYAGQQVSFFYETILVALWDFGFLLIALAYFAGWVKNDGLGRAAVVWTAIFFLVGIPVWAVVQWLFPATSSQFAISFMNPANRDTIAQGVVGTISRNPRIFLAVVAIITGLIMRSYKATKQIGSILLLLGIPALIVAIIFSFATGRSGSSTSTTSAYDPAGEYYNLTAINGDEVKVIFSVRAMCRTVVIADEPAAKFKAEGIIRTPFGDCGPDGVRSTLPRQFLLCREAVSYALVGSIDEGATWFPIGSSRQMELPVGRQVWLAANIKLPAYVRYRSTPPKYVPSGTYEVYFLKPAG